MPSPASRCRSALTMVHVSPPPHSQRRWTAPPPPAPWPWRPTAASSSATCRAACTCWLPLLASFTVDAVADRRGARVDAAAVAHPRDGEGRLREPGRAVRRDGLRADGPRGGRDGCVSWRGLRRRRAHARRVHRRELARDGGVHGRGGCVHAARDAGEAVHDRRGGV